MDISALSSAIGDLATALVFGGMAIFSFLVAPMAFRTLDKDQAAALMRGTFPVYYRVMAVASVIAAASFAVAGRNEEWALAAVALGFVGLLYFLLPALEIARGERSAGRPDAERRFARLHRLSVALNFGQFLIVLAAMIGLF